MKNRRRLIKKKAITKKVISMWDKINSSESDVRDNIICKLKEVNMGPEQIISYTNEDIDLFLDQYTPAFILYVDYWNPLHDAEVNCTICLEDCCDGDMVRKLRCSHMFHKACIDEWFMDVNQKRTCPCCRNVVRSPYLEIIKVDFNDLKRIVDEMEMKDIS